MSLGVDVLLSETGTCQKCSKPMRRGEIIFLVERPTPRPGVRRCKMICGDCGGEQIERLRAIARTSAANSPEQSRACDAYRAQQDEIVG